MSSIASLSDSDRAKKLAGHDEGWCREQAEVIRELDRLYGNRKILAVRIGADEELVSKAYASPSGSLKLVKFLREIAWFERVIGGMERQIRERDEKISHLEWLLWEKLKR